MPDPPRVVVVGGGITGLATAWYLRSGAAAGRLDITVCESDDRLGGKIRTETIGGVPVEAGPDTFLARVEGATELAREVGLGDDLLAPATGAAFICHGGRLHPLPAGTVLGVPVTARSLLGTGLLSPAGRARAALDLVLPRRPFGPDPTVADVIGARLGREALERLVEPLVGGINAGTAANLSLRSTARPLATAAERHRSMILGLRAERRASSGSASPGPSGPPSGVTGPSGPPSGVTGPSGPPSGVTGAVFLSVAGGMGRLVDGVAASLDDVDVRLGTAATSVTADGRGWRVACEPGPDVCADAVVITVPAFAAAPLLAGVSPDAATLLASIRYASVVTATLAYRPGALPGPLEGSGFLVPRGENRLITACTFSTSKWPDLARSGLVLLRASVGRHGDDRAAGLDDDTLVSRIHQELSGLVGLTEDPVASRVDRWTNGFPQYEPGHDDRVDRIEAALAPLGGVVVAGAAFRGVGVAACVQQARAAAARVGAVLSREVRGPRET